MVALTRALAPIADRFDAVPARSSVNQWLVLPLL